MRYELNGKVDKKTGAKWSQILGLTVSSFDSFGGERNFLTNLYDKMTFLELVSLCEVKKAVSLTRRDAYNLKRKLEKGLD